VRLMYPRAKVALSLAATMVFGAPAANAESKHPNAATSNLQKATSGAATLGTKVTRGTPPLTFLCSLDLLPQSGADSPPHFRGPRPSESIARVEWEAKCRDKHLLPTA
jgi:hypothetical protein